jgi:hypothetical protein
MEVYFWLLGWVDLLGSEAGVSRYKGCDIEYHRSNQLLVCMRILFELSTKLLSKGITTDLYRPSCLLDHKDPPGIPMIRILWIDPRSS